MHATARCMLDDALLLLLELLKPHWPRARCVRLGRACSLTCTPGAPWLHLLSTSSSERTRFAVAPECGPTWGVSAVSALARARAGRARAGATKHPMLLRRWPKRGSPPAALAEARAQAAGRAHLALWRSGKELLVGERVGLGASARW